MTQFVPICSDDLPVFPPDVVKNLSVDQQYLYQICHGIQAGNISAALSMKQPGPLVHSRFLTTANRTLRYYISQSHASGKLKTLANFIIKVYAPMWFLIKMEDSFLMGPRHICKYISLIRENFDQPTQKIRLNVVERNCYFAHPENVLLAMLTDVNINIREKAAKSILESRKNAKSNEPRKFRRPKLNLASRHYYDLSDITMVEPPFTQEMTSDQVLSCIENEQNYVRAKSQHIPCHTQAVERLIQLVSHTSTAVIGEKRRHERVCSTIESRAILSKMNSRADYENYMKN